MTFTGLVGATFWLPLRAIIALCVRLRIHPNVLTFTGVLINVAAAWALALGHFVTAGVIMTLANIFDFIDGKVAGELELSSDFGGFWDSVMDASRYLVRRPHLPLLAGPHRLRHGDGARDDVHDLTSYTRACRIGRRQVQGRLHGAQAYRAVPIGAFTNRMAAVLWVVLVRRSPPSSRASTHVAGPQRPEMRSRSAATACRSARSPTPSAGRSSATWQYDIMVILILAFVWLTRPTGPATRWRTARGRSDG
jgi:CDP-diacylglycerol--glycerol-3-phosphate 3-phosphatidyltransferase